MKTVNVSLDLILKIPYSVPQIVQLIQKFLRSCYLHIVTGYTRIILLKVFTNQRRNDTEISTQYHVNRFSTENKRTGSGQENILQISTSIADTLLYALIDLYFWFFSVKDASNSLNSCFRSDIIFNAAARCSFIFLPAKMMHFVITTNSRAKVILQKYS